MRFIDFMEVEFETSYQQLNLLATQCNYNANDKTNDDNTKVEEMHYV